MSWIIEKSEEAGMYLIMLLAMLIEED